MDGGDKLTAADRLARAATRVQARSGSPQTANARPQILLPTLQEAN